MDEIGEQQMKIGYQGVPGSYSEAALLGFSKNQPIKKSMEVVQYSSFITLIQDLAKQKLDAIVLPVENSTTGQISRTMDYLRYEPIIATQENYQSIQHTLWGTPGSKLEDITHVYSHPEALSQTQVFFDKHKHLKAIAFQNTAKAAEYIAHEKDPTKAALASQRAGEIYGLVPLKETVQTEKTNTTRFFLLQHQNKASQLKGSRVIYYIETPHESGALLKLLQVFNIYECNMQRLNSRPIKGVAFKYGFFIEVDYQAEKVSLSDLNNMIQQVTDYYQVLGHLTPNPKADNQHEIINIYP